jgi:hypothetical protein
MENLCIKTLENFILNPGNQSQTEINDSHEFLQLQRGISLATELSQDLLDKANTFIENKKIDS